MFVAAFSTVLFFLSGQTTAIDAGEETMRVTNVGDTIVDIKLRSDIPDKDIDKLLIKGLGSALIPAPSGPISILR